MDVATALDGKAEGEAEEVSAANNTPEASQSTDMIEQRPAPEAVKIPAGAPGIVKATTFAKKTISENGPSRTTRPSILRSRWRRRF